MKNKTPQVSLIMPVYNAGEFLVESLESVLAQTFNNWELICVNDGSTDNTLQILEKYSSKDKRIRVYRLKDNAGVSRAANFALSKAKGEFLARMDADDVMLPKRLEKQVNFLLKHPETVIVGGQCLIINEYGKVTGDKIFPTNHEDIYRMLFQSMPIQQPTFMVNLARLPKRFHWYKAGQNTAEEVDLLFRLTKYGKYANLPEFVLKYRIHTNNLSLKNPKKTFSITYKTRKRAVSNYGYKPSLKAQTINLVQYLVIRLLPESIIYPLFSVWRGQTPALTLITTVFKSESLFSPLLKRSLSGLESRTRTFVSLFI